MNLEKKKETESMALAAQKQEKTYYTLLWRLSVKVTPSQW